MTHNIIVIDIVNGQPFSIKPSDQEIQAIADTEDFYIIDPLNNTMRMEDGTWEPIPTASVHQSGGTIQVR